MSKGILRKNRLRLRDCLNEISVPFYAHQKMLFQGWFDRNVDKEEIGSYLGRKVTFESGFDLSWRRVRDAMSRGSQSVKGWRKLLDAQALELFKLRMSPGYAYPSKAEVIEMNPADPFVELEPTKPLVQSNEVPLVISQAA